MTKSNVWKDQSWGFLSFVVWRLFGKRCVQQLTSCFIIRLIHASIGQVTCPPIEVCPQIEVLRGRDGRDGRDGTVGPPGPPGEKGDGGLPGEKGCKGDSGMAGPQGPSGEIGPMGAPGAHGSPGPRGPVGSPGSPGMLGPRGPAGQPGPTGRVTNCGQTYIRWGRTTCPANQSTELVYAGRAGGSWYDRTGGATNHLCMPNDPDYLQYASGVQGYSYVYGVEYDPNSGQPFNVQPDVNNHNAPCAVCKATSRCCLLMIPAKTNCPTSWTTEYVGYLMTSRQNHDLPTEYVCVDKDPESVAGLDAVNWNQGGQILYHVEASCNGMACPPYDAEKELTCVVCTQ